MLASKKNSKNEKLELKFSQKMRSSNYISYTVSSKIQTDETDLDCIHVYQCKKIK